jgi:hypothetical protein
VFRNTGFEQPVDGIGFPDIETDIIQVVIGGDVIPSAFPPEEPTRSRRGRKPKNKD